MSHKEKLKKLNEAQRELQLMRDKDRLERFKAGEDLPDLIKDMIPNKEQQHSLAEQMGVKLTNDATLSDEERLLNQFGVRDPSLASSDYYKDLAEEVDKMGKKRSALGNVFREDVDDLVDDEE